MILKRLLRNVVKKMVDLKNTVTYPALVMAVLPMQVGFTLLVDYLNQYFENASEVKVLEIIKTKLQ